MENKDYFNYLQILTTLSNEIEFSISSIKDSIEFYQDQLDSWTVDENQDLIRNSKMRLFEQRSQLRTYKSIAERIRQLTMEQRYDEGKTFDEVHDQPENRAFDAKYSRR